MLGIYRAIKSKSIKVSIDGHGADELFIGYGHIKNLMIFQDLYQNLKSFYQ